MVDSHLHFGTLQGHLGGASIPLLTHGLRPDNDDDDDGGKRRGVSACQSGGGDAGHVVTGCAAVGRLLNKSPM